MAVAKKPRATPADPGALEKLRRICLSLPDTKETLTWGSPHFRVGDKISSGIGDEKGRLAIGFKLEMDDAEAVIQDPRFWRAPFVGRGVRALDRPKFRKAPQGTRTPRHR